MTELINKRLEAFQKHPSIELQKKSNEKFHLQLRKSKRTILLQKKRQINFQSSDFSSYTLFGSNTHQLLEAFPELQSAPDDLSKLKIYSSLLKHTETPKIFLIEILNILSNCLYSSTPTTDPRPYFIENDILSVLCSLIKHAPDLELVAQAIWCLNNLLGGQFNYCEEVLNLGLVNRLFELLVFDDFDVIENIAYCFGNLIIESEDVCGMVLESNFITKIVSIEEFSDKLAHAVGFCLKCITLHTEILSLVTCSGILKIFERIYEQDPAICLGGIMNLTKSSLDVIRVVISSNIIECIFEGLKGPSQICVLSSGIIANISTGEISEENFLLSKKILDVFLEILKNIDEYCCCNIYWTLSNLALGTPGTRSFVSKHRICFEFEFVFNHWSNKVRLEGARFYQNIFKYASVDTKDELIDAGIFLSLCQNLLSFDVEFVCKCLNIAGLLLATGKFTGKNLKIQFEESGCLTNVEKIVYSDCIEISNSARDLINTYFS